MINVPTWSPALSVGNALIDRQHQQLLSLCAQAVDAFESAAPDKERFHELLNDVAALAARHFDTEERTLARHGCPTLATHKAEHEKYLDLLAEILVKATNQELDRAGLESFLSDWLGHHLHEVDLPERHYLRKD